MALKRKYFGTDGIRGRVGELPLTQEWVLKLAYALGQLLIKQTLPKKVLIGKDTRISGSLFETALQAGLSAQGIDSYLLGVMPTPAVAALTASEKAGFGIVITASHNPYYDNGLKFFTCEGDKLPDEWEAELEWLIDAGLQSPAPPSRGLQLTLPSATLDYVRLCKNTFPSHLDLSHLKVVLDCAHGATYEVAQTVFTQLGAEVCAINVSPDGYNINADCGAVHPQNLSAQVLSVQADLGIAFDGDGDRLIMVDHTGAIVDGDELLYIITQGYLATQTLKGGVVGTVMSNLGLELALQALHVEFIRTPVGDRHIMAALKERGWILGGEASGHLMCLDTACTGDAIIAALKVLAVLQNQSLSLFALKQGMKKYPQILINVPLKTKRDILNHPSMIKAMHSVEATLKGTGRILLRASGTEPLLRIMIEGQDADLIKRLAGELAALANTLSSA